MFRCTFGRWFRFVRSPMEVAPRLRAMGSPADVGNRYDRYCAVLDALLATPHRKPQSANHSVQSPALAVPLARYQRQKDCLLAHHSSIVLPVPDRRPIPVVCRGHLEFGIMFAATKCTSY